MKSDVMGGKRVKDEEQTKKQRSLLFDFFYFNYNL